MTNKERAQILMNEASGILSELEKVFEQQSWNRVVRRSQEVVELALKSLFKLMNVEYPKIHDVAPVLEKILLEKKISVDLKTLQEVKLVSKSLTEKRAPAFYAEVLYDKEEAEKAMQGAKKVFEFSTDLANTLNWR